MDSLKVIVFLVVFGLFFNLGISYFNLHDELAIIGDKLPSGKKTGKFLAEKVREKYGIKKRGDDCKVYCPIGQYCKKMKDARGRISEVCMP